MSAEKATIISKVKKENKRIVKENIDLRLQNEVRRSLSEEMIDALLRFKLGDDKDEDQTQQIFKELSNQTKLIAENKRLKRQVQAYEENEKLLEMDEAFKVQLSRKSSLLQMLKDLNSTEDLQAIFNKIEDLEKEKTKLLVSKKRLEERNSALQQRLKEISNLSEEDLLYAQEILKGQVSYLTRRLNIGGGSELPPCWANKKSGKAEYLFSVIIGENAIRVAPKWPKYREKELKKYGSLSKLFNRNMTVDYFLKQVEPIYHDSDQKECKHYLYMFDDAKTKDGYKEKRLRLENYFYKYEDDSKHFKHF